MGIPENIDALLIKYDINQDCLARIAEVAPSAITRWRHGAMPRRNAIARICKHFGLEEDDILSDKVGLAAKEHGKNSDSLNTRTIKGMPMGYVPLRGKVHAGTPDEPEVYEQEMVLAPQFLIDDDPDLYACKSEGDCMNRVYPEGCIIFVSPNKEPRNGSVAVVTIDGTDTVMRRMLRTSNTLVLSPDSFNPENRDIIITSDDGRVVEYGGKVVWYQPDGEME